MRLSAGHLGELFCSPGAAQPKLMYEEVVRQEGEEGEGVGHLGVPADERRERAGVVGGRVRRPVQKVAPEVVKAGRGITQNATVACPDPHVRCGKYSVCLLPRDLFVHFMAKLEGGPIGSVKVRPE
jgi:hypothetical protein